MALFSNKYLKTQCFCHFADYAYIHSQFDVMIINSIQKAGEGFIHSVWRMTFIHISVLFEHNRYIYKSATGD